MLYKQADEAKELTYIVLVGRLKLLGHLGKEDRFDTLGEVVAGDTLGEEGYLEVGTVRRRETAVISEDNTYLMEISKDGLEIAKKHMKNNDLSLDWFTLLNYMKR